MPDARRSAGLADEVAGPGDGRGRLAPSLGRAGGWAWSRCRRSAGSHPGWRRSVQRRAGATARCTGARRLPARAADVQAVVGAGSGAPPDDCAQRNADVQRAKDRVGRFQPAACLPGMPRWGLEARAQAWLDLAVARARQDEKCWAGGDEGHQQAQASAWSHVARCTALIK